MSRSVMSPIRMAFASLVFAASAGLSACLQSTEPQPSVLGLSGSWSYTGVQTGLIRETLTGTLTISQESGTSFQGRLDLLAVSAETGHIRILGGPVSGSENGIDVIDFDANLDAIRRHVGQIVGDTITGTWIGFYAGGHTYSGTFRVEREAR